MLGEVVGRYEKIMAIKKYPLPPAVYITNAFSLRKVTIVEQREYLSSINVLKKLIKKNE